MTRIAIRTFILDYNCEYKWALEPQIGYRPEFPSSNTFGAIIPNATCNSFGIVEIAITETLILLPRFNLDFTPRSYQYLSNHPIQKYHKCVTITSDLIKTPTHSDSINV